MESLRARTWLAVKGQPADIVLARLELRTGVAATRPRRFPIEGARSDAGWYLVVADGYDHRLIQPPVLQRLSEGCDVVTCTVEERNLSSTATGWRNGQPIWSVVYEGEEAPGAVATSGALPPAFEFIHRDYTARAAADDAGDLLLDPLFEIAIETVRHAVEFRPDMPSAAFDGRFVGLEATNPTLKQRLFGG